MKLCYATTSIKSSLKIDEQLMEKAFFNTIKKFAFQLADKKSFLNEFAFEIDKLSAISIEVDLSGKSYEENIRILTKESLNTFAYGNGTFSN